MLSCSTALVNKPSSSCKGELGLFAFRRKSLTYVFLTLSGQAVRHRLVWGDNMNPCELTASITAFANLLANQLTDGDLELAAALFTQLGDTLATIAVQRAQSRLSCNQRKKIQRKDP